MYRNKRTAVALMGFCLLTAIVLGACASQAESGASEGARETPIAGTPEPLVTEERALQVGQTFELRLPSNPTTGYRWELEPMDEARVAALEDVYVDPSAADRRVGAGGEQVFSFKALAMGATEIMLVYHRPWEQDVEPLYTHIITLTVE